MVCFSTLPQFAAILIRFLTHFLLYSYGANPWGVASIAQTRLKNTQPYDISVSLTLPKSPTNLERGNFMVALHLLDDIPPPKKQQKLDSPLPPQPTSSYTTGPLGQLLLPVQRDPSFYFAGKNIMFTSTRPGLLPYTDPLVSLASRIFFIAYHVLKPHSEYTTLRINLAENLAFPRGAVLPTSVFVEVQAGQSLQVHKASATFAAQLAGLRYFMYYWRVTAFLGFTAAFWVCEVGFMVVTWGLASVLLGGGGKSDGGGAVVKVEEGEQTVKRDNNEEEGMSPTERTFPSTSKQPPIKYEGRIKQEEGEAQGIAPDAHPAAEADDEDEDDGELEGEGAAYRDSGIGTSYDDNVSREGVKRRVSGRSGRG